MATATAKKQEKKVSLTTGIGIISFPHLFASTASKNDKGETVYDVQILIPKSQRDDVRAIMRGIKEVAEGKWGANWKKVRNPLRDGDKEKDELTEDGRTKEEAYPERLGHYFLNARTTKPVGVYDRGRNVITDPGEVYGGMKGKIAITFFPYSNSGNHGVGAGLDGVQKIADGEPFGDGRPSVESMFDLLDDEEDFDLDDDTDEVDDLDDEPEPPKKRAAKKAAAKPAAKKAAARKPKVEEIEEDDDLSEFDDLDDLDDDI